MKHLRKKIFMVMVLIFSISVLVPVSAYAASPDSIDQPITGIAPYNNNVNRCHTSFIIINGTAVVDAAYTGYSNITTEAIIEIKIQKKTCFGGRMSPTDNPTILGRIIFTLVKEMSHIHYRLGKKEPIE